MNQDEDADADEPKIWNRDELELSEIEALLSALPPECEAIRKRIWRHFQKMEKQVADWEETERWHIDTARRDGEIRGRRMMAAAVMCTLGSSGLPDPYVARDTECANALHAIRTLKALAETKPHLRPVRSFEQILADAQRIESASITGKGPRT